MALSDLSSDMADIEVSALKEALLTQHQIMQKLYLELEEERESAATAASEALSMILRLQGEKAAEHMEASQYKRMTEERLYYAQESLAVFEELLCSKELEIASLEFQIQAYRKKLLSIGFPDIDTSDMRFFESSSKSSNGAQLGDTSAQGIGRRASLPVMKLNFSRSDIATDKRKGHSLSIREMTTEKPDGHQISGLDDSCDSRSKFSPEISALPEESVVEDFRSCLVKMNNLGEQMKPLSHNEKCEETSSWVSENNEAFANIAAYSVSSKSQSGCHCGFELQTEGSISCPFSRAEDGSEFNKCCVQSPRVKDVYAVSQYQNQVTQGVMSRDEPREMETILIDTTEDNGNEKCKLSKQRACVERELKICTQADVNPNGFHCLVRETKIDGSLKESDMVEIRNRVMKLENVIDTMKVQESDKRTEEMKLLRQINEQLESIHSQIINPKSEKRSAPNKSMDYIIEAMLSFSI
ncbi:hypothetical protein H6P81_000421 [Aristolochia fimbriata]|uniref:GTD-binding domain-containing protein n=1 Tax=Aristolochia fimbriata TaxID=158543 RepID=A0AAV7F8K8_ARIFI|nr:hypothetical protein H6P81_000421 [Aristolochia fimbriata]